MRYQTALDLIQDICLEPNNRLLCVNLEGLFNDLEDTASKRFHPDTTVYYSNKSVVSFKKIIDIADFDYLRGSEFNYIFYRERNPEFNVDYLKSRLRTTNKTLGLGFYTVT